MDDITLMRLALAEAEKAAALGEVPVGAVVAKDGEPVAVAHNTRETGKNATHHAELLAIDAACRVYGQQLGVMRGILAGLPRVVCHRHRLPVLRHYRAYRHLAQRSGFFRFGQRQTHQRDIIHMKPTFLISRTAAMPRAAPCTPSPAGTAAQTPGAPDGSGGSWGRIPGGWA